MALRRESDTAVRDLLDTELIFEIPPPDVVSSINECFQEFTNTSEKRKDASVHKPSSDSDSGESLFITQSVSKEVQTERPLLTPKRSASISDDSGYERERVTGRLPENQDTEDEDGGRSVDLACPKISKKDIYVPPKKASFPFLLKSLKREHLPLEKQQILENSEIGGFFKCIKRIEESYDDIFTGSTFSVSDLIDEGDEDNSDHEVTIVDRNIFVPHYNKEKRQQWLPESILKRRNQDSQRVKKTNLVKTHASVKKQIKNKTQKRISKSKAGAKTSCISLTEKEKQQETHEVLASCSEAEDSPQISQCVEDSQRNDQVVIEETQRNSVEEVTETVEHEEDTSSRTDHDQPNQSNFVLPPQGGDISIQNDIQQPDSDSCSVDLFRPLDSPEHKNNQNDETPSIKPNMEDSDQDSDVTQIEMEGQFMSTFGPDTQNWCDSEPQAQENNSEITQKESEGQFMSTLGPEAQIVCDAESYAEENNSTIMEGESVSVLEMRTPNKQITTQDIKDSQKTVQSPQKDEIKHKNKKREMSGSLTEDTGVEEAVNVQQSSKHLPLADEPLRNVSTRESESAIKGKAMVEMEIDTQDSPLFKNNGLSFLRRKKKRKEKTDAAELIQSDTNIHGLQNSMSDSQADDVTGPETTHRQNRESHEVESRLIIEEQTEISVLQTDAALEDDTEITKVKRKKMKKSKLKELVDVEPFVESQSVEMAQFSEVQTTELMTKRVKKKRKDKKRTKTAYAEENDTDIPSNETFDSNTPAELRLNELNQSSEAPEADQPGHIQILEKITECTSPNVNELKLVKKKKKKKRHESQLESADLDMSSASQFDAGFRVIKQREEQVIVERQVNNCENEHLECETVRVSEVSKHRKKRQNTSFLVDEMTELEKHRSDNTPETSNLDSDGIVLKKDKNKKKKKKKLMEQNETEPASDADNNKQLCESSELQTTELLPRRKKKKRTNKDREVTTIRSSDELLGHTDDRPSEKRESNMIQSNENNQLEHLQTSEELTRCPSPRKKKKKKNRSDEHQHESVDLNQNVSSVSHFDDVTGLRAADQVTTQNIIDERLNDGSPVEHLEGNLKPGLKVGKRKKKRQNLSLPSQLDDIIGPDSGLHSGNIVEHEDKINSSALSDNSKQKKKKCKLIEQDVEPAADIHSVHNVHSVESDQFDESQTTELIPKRKKKKKKDKERTKFAHAEENNAKEDQLNETFEASQIYQPPQEHIEVTQCPSPNGTKFKSTKKKKKRKRDETEEPQYHDVSSVSQFDLSTTQETEERPSDVTEHTKRKKKRKQSHFSEDCDISAVQLEVETVTPERKKKKNKRNTDCITNVGEELTSGTPDCTTDFERSQSPILKSSDRISKKLKRKMNKEMNKSTGHFLENTTMLEVIQTKKSDSVIQYNNVDGTTSLPDSEDSTRIKKKKKKRKNTEK